MNGTNTIVDYLTSVPAWYLATCEGDQPHVRPFSFAAVQDGRIWFCPATTKDVSRELEPRRAVAATPHRPSNSWPTVVSKPPAMRSSMSTVGFAFPLSISMRYLRLTPTMRAKDVCDTFALARSLAILVPS